MFSLLRTPGDVNGGGNFKKLKIENVKIAFFNILELTFHIKIWWMAETERVPLLEIQFLVVFPSELISCKIKDAWKWSKLESGQNSTQILCEINIPVILGAPKLLFLRIS